MYKIFEKYGKRITDVNTSFKRYLYNKIDWNERLIGIVGARGVGKTTLMLQYIKENYKDISLAAYLSLDDLFFTENKLTDVVDFFVSRGGKTLFLDEVHKYPTWSIELKNIYDLYPQLKVVFSASSILDIYKGQADLSRRVALYNLRTLSLREFVNITQKTNFKPLTIEQLLSNHQTIAAQITFSIKPLKEFDNFLKIGAYPFFLEGQSKYFDKLNQAVLQVIENDIPQIININTSQIKKIKLLMYVISTSAPFVPNISKLAQKVEIDRKYVYQYLDLLERANLIINLRQPTTGVAAFNKPEKIFLHNTNLIYLFAENTPNRGTLRETFFINQVSAAAQVHYTPKTDFIVDRKYFFEIGGKSKTHKQIKDLDNAFIAADDIETGFADKIPLWLFGFLY